MDPMIMKALGTALERALAVAEDHLSKANAVKSANIVACVEYLRAAQSAITGLEDEVDEILIEAKMVARFYWDKRAALYERIDRYLNRDRLRPLLDQAIQGITSCHKFAERDSKGFFQLAEKADAGKFGDRGNSGTVSRTSNGYNIINDTHAIPGTSPHLLAPREGVRLAFHWKCVIAPQTIIDYFVAH